MLRCTLANSLRLGLLCRLAMMRSSDMLCSSAMLMLWLSSWSRHMRRQVVLTHQHPCNVQSLL